MRESSVARWVALKFEKPTKIPHFHKFVSLEISIQEPKFPKSELKFPINKREFLESGGKSPYLATLRESLIPLYVWEAATVLSPTPFSYCMLVREWRQTNVRTERQVVNLYVRDWRQAVSLYVRDWRQANKRKERHIVCERACVCVCVRVCVCMCVCVCV